MIYNLKEKTNPTNITTTSLSTNVKKNQILPAERILPQDKEVIIRVAHLYSFLYCVFVLFCLRPVSCVPNAVSFFGVSIPDYLFILWQDSFSRQYLIFFHVC
jgi:hypothetical protein